MTTAQYPVEAATTDESDFPKRTENEARRLVLDALPHLKARNFHVLARRLSDPKGKSYPGCQVYQVVVLEDGQSELLIANVPDTKVGDVPVIEFGEAYSGTA